MQVLVAAPQHGYCTSGCRHALPGELVGFPIEPPGASSQHLVGLTTGRPATLFRVFESSLVTRRDVRLVLVSFYVAQPGSRHLAPSLLQAIVDEDLAELLRLASLFPPGWLLQRRDRTLLPCVVPQVCALVG